MARRRTIFEARIGKFLNFADMNVPVKIFIIYAREDAAYKEELVKALSPFNNQGWVESWHDGKILPGQPWDEQIRQNLNAADVVLPLVSSDFFASGYIQQVEIRHAFERYEQQQCIILPVIVRACAWESDERIARLQLLPTEGKPIGSWTNQDEAYRSVVEGIRRIVRPDAVQNIPPPIDVPEIKSPVLHLKKTEKTSWKQKVQPYIRTIQVAAAVVAVATFLLTYFGCPQQSSPDSLELKAFRAAMDAGTIPALATFRLEHPDGFRALEAQQQLDKLKVRFDSCVGSARALHRGGEKEEAQKAAAAAARINPDDPQTTFLIRELSN